MPKIKNLLIRLGLVILFCATVLNLPRLNNFLKRHTPKQQENIIAAKLGPGTIYKQLKTVKDPELGISIIDLGLIKDVLIEGDKVSIGMILTSPFCPYADILIYEIKYQVKKIEGVSQVRVAIDLEAAWHPDMISEQGRKQLESLVNDH